MINITEPLKLPKKIKIFFFTKSALIMLAGLLPSLYFGWDALMFRYLATLLLFLAGLTYLIWYLEYLNFSIFFHDQSVTIRSGIVIRRAKDINLGAIQTIELVYNPLVEIFGLCEVQIWTSSPQQLDAEEGTTNNRPEISFYYDKATAPELKELFKVVR